MIHSFSASQNPATAHFGLQTHHHQPNQPPDGAIYLSRHAARVLHSVFPEPGSEVVIPELIERSALGPKGAKAVLDELAKTKLIHIEGDIATRLNQFA